MRIDNKDIFIGIDVGGTNIRCAAISKSIGIISYKKEKIENKNSKEKVIKQIILLIDSLFTKKIKGIAVGVPSIVDLRKGIVYEANNIPSWKEVPLKKILENRYKVPVLINNDANCFAMGEKNFGSGKGYKDIVGVILGNGFGAGIVINGKLYCGNDCAAGEFGRTPFKDNTIEDYCSGKFFDMHGISGEELHKMAEKGNKRALQIFNEFGIIPLCRAYLAHIKFFFTAEERNEFVGEHARKIRFPHAAEFRAPDFIVMTGHHQYFQFCRSSLRTRIGFAQLIHRDAVNKKNPCEEPFDSVFYRRPQKNE